MNMEVDEPPPASEPEIDEIESELQKYWADTKGLSNSSMEDAKSIVTGAFGIVFEKDNTLTSFIKTMDKYKTWVACINEIRGKSRQELVAANDYLIPKTQASRLRPFNRGKEFEAVVKAFNIGYNDPGEFVQCFIKEFMINFGKNWDSTVPPCFSPYCSIVQASGMGKSRFIREVGNFEFVFFVCLRKRGPPSRGFPLRSAIADKLTPSNESRDELELLYCRFFISCLQLLDRRKLVNPQYSPADMMMEQLKMEDKKEESGSAFWEEVSEIMKALSRETKQKLLDMFGSKFGALREVPICFAFDEASVMFENSFNGDFMFKACRKALSEFIPNSFANKPILTGVFIDTKCRITRKFPTVQSERVEPSLRAVIPKTVLHTPLWCVPGWNQARNLNENGTLEALFESMRDVLNEQSPILDWEKAAEYAGDLISIGRPFWKTFYDSLIELKSPEAAAFKSVLELAKTKLALENPADHHEITGEKLLAVLDARLALSVSGCSTVASELVAQNMAACYFVSQNRDFVVCGYPVEPVIAIAAMYWMNVGNFTTQIDLLIECVAEGLVERGYRGELLSRVMLTVGFDKALKSLLRKQLGTSLDTIRFVSVQRFLGELYGDRMIKTLESSCEGNKDRLNNFASLLAGQVNIKQWIKVDKDIKFASAEYYFSLGVAIMTKDCAKAKDKLVPVRISTGKYSWIIVEDKNNSVRDYSKYNVADTHSAPQTFPDVDQAAPEPYLILYCQFGDTTDNTQFESLYTYHPPGTRSGQVPLDNLRKFVVGVFGISPASYQFLAKYSANEQELIVEKLKLLRDGTLVTAAHSHQYLDKFWDALKIDSQKLHGIQLTSSTSSN